MRLTLTFLRINLRNLKNKSPFQFTGSTKLNRRQAHLARFGALFILLAVAISSTFSSSSFAAQKNSSLANVGHLLFWPSSEPQASMSPALNWYLPWVLTPQAAPDPETITLYESTCTTPQTEFTFGEVVCAKVTNIPTGIARRIVWVDPNGFIEKSTTITADGQTDNWTNPPTATGLIAGFFVIENRGTWRASIATSRGSVVASAFYTLKHPTIASTDLSVNITPLGSDSPAAGGEVQYLAKITNNGPDGATNVRFKSELLANITLDSVTQVGGPSFTCVSGSVDCSIASLPKDGSAQFLLEFTAGSAGSVITNKVSVSSGTVELNSADNEYSAQPLSVVTGGPPPACIMECPNHIAATVNTTNQNDEPGATVNYPGADAQGTCGTVSYSIPSGSFFPVGTTTVTATSSEGGGACTFTVTVVEAAGPSISCPATYETTLTNGCSTTIAASDLGTPTTSGGSGIVTVSSERSDNLLMEDPFSVGTTTITWTATDDIGRFSTCTQIVKINPDTSDTTNPTITAPANLTLSSGTSGGACGLIVGEAALGTAEATDGGCSVTITRTGVPAGNFFPVGTTTITWKATDAAGNFATATQTVTIVEDTPPIIFAPPDATYDCPSAVPAANPSQATGPDIIDGSGNAQPGPPSDNCGTPVVTVAQTQSGAGSAASPLIISRTFTATDAAGNTASATQTITVIDDTAPVLGACPTDIVMTLPPNSTATSMPVSFSLPTASDSCDTNVAVTASQASGSSFPVGTTQVTVTAADDAGNTDSCTFNVTVLYDFSGFFSPVNNSAMNLVNAGRSIPIKFSLSGNKGLNIMAAGYPLSSQIACGSETVNDIEAAETAGNSSLSYDPTSDQYIFVWKTESSWAGTCRELVIKLNDGSTHTAKFKFK